MLRVSCGHCGSMFLLAELPTGPILCHRCHTVEEGIKKHLSPKRKPPTKQTKDKSNGTGSST